MITNGNSGQAFSLSCMSASPNSSFGFKYRANQPNGAYCYVGTYSDGSCTTPTFSGFPPEIYATDGSNSWQSVYLFLPSGTNSILVSCFDWADPATVYFDQFYLNLGSNTY
jgi:hypothetical protein